MDLPPREKTLKLRDLTNFSLFFQFLTATIGHCSCEQSPTEGTKYL
jgi:hypothetical protein